MKLDGYEGEQCDNSGQVVITGGVEEKVDEKAERACTSFLAKWESLETACGDTIYDFTISDSEVDAEKLCEKCMENIAELEEFAVDFWPALNNADCNVTVAGTTHQAAVLAKAAFGTCLTVTDAGGEQERCHTAVQELLSTAWVSGGASSGGASSGGASGTMHVDDVTVSNSEWTDTATDPVEPPIRRLEEDRLEEENTSEQVVVTSHATGPECVSACAMWGGAYSNMLGGGGGGSVSSPGMGVAVGEPYPDPLPPTEGQEDPPPTQGIAVGEPNPAAPPPEKGDGTRRELDGAFGKRLQEHFDRISSICNDDFVPDLGMPEPAIGENADLDDANRAAAGVGDDDDDDAADDEDMMEMTLVAELDIAEADFNTVKRESYKAAVAAAAEVPVARVAIVKVTPLAAARRLLLAAGIAVETAVKFPAGTDSAALPSAAELSTKISSELEAEGLTATVKSFAETQTVQPTPTSPASLLFPCLATLLLAAPTLLAALI